MRLAYLLLALVLFSGCNAMCFASADPNLPLQSGDDMTHLAWYGFPACMAADVLP